MAWLALASGDPHGAFHGACAWDRDPEPMTDGAEAAAALERVLRRAELGDREAFAELYQRFSPDVRRLCRRLLGDSGEDAHSEVFLRAQSSFAQYDRARPFRTWLLSVAAHLCLDQLRRGSVEGRLFDPAELDPDAVTGAGGNPLRSLLQARERDRLSRALGELSERDRIVLELRYFAELSYAEIAEALELQPNAVGVALHRAKTRLRRAVGS